MQELHYTRAGAAHEPLKNHPAFGGGVREKDFSLLALAPDGARAALEEKFSELCEVWIRPYGIDKKAALKAFVATYEEHGDRVLAKHGVDIADYILASARNWTAKKAAKWLPKLEEWLANEAWRNEPAPDKGGDRGGGESAGERLMRRAGAQ